MKNSWVATSLIFTSYHQNLMPLFGPVICPGAEPSRDTSRIDWGKGWSHFSFTRSDWRAWCASKRPNVFFCWHEIMFLGIYIYILWTVNFRLFESKWMCNENHKIINHPYLCASSLPGEEVGAEKKGCTQRCMTRAAALLLKRSFHVGSKLGTWDMRMEFGERLMAFRCKNTKLSVKKKKQTKDI